MSNPTEALAGSRLKLKRAWKQLDGLKADIGAFLDGAPYRPNVDFNKQTQRLSVHVQIKKAPDPMWGVRIGEIVHNFRSALDHVVWQLARCPSPKEAKTQFPIFAHEAGFSLRGTKEFLKGVNLDAVSLIKSEQPFPESDGGTGEGTNSPLWHLKELSDIDKHRTLHVTAMTLTSYSFKFPTVAVPFQTFNVWEHPGGQIQQDTELWSATLSTRNWPFAKGDIQGGFEVEIAFEDGIPAANLWGVRGTMDSVGNRTERILARIAKDILRTEL